MGDAIGWGPPPANDERADAEEVSSNDVVVVDNTFATNAADDPELSCTLGGNAHPVGTVWYKFVATDTSALISTGRNSFGDTLIGVYVDDSGTLVELDCSDDTATLRSAVCVENLEIGEIHYIQFATYTDFSRGVYQLTVTSPRPGDPPNDLFDDAIGPLAVPSLTQGTTVGALPDFGFGEDSSYTVVPACAGVLVTSPGVWYWVEGTGAVLTVALCTQQTTFDTKLSVYSWDDPDLTCVAANDDACGVRSRVSWPAAAGVPYHVLVHSVGCATGPFALEVAEISLGDLNCDGTVDGFDVDAFMLALMYPDRYATTYPDCDIKLADCNADGLVNGFDIDSFVALLTGD
ncbi:MAG: hypothetical protein KKB50_11565 [Planctomycetes bacterium]|nr:hypothetical protein [Planctomycetota bacterium]